jgi:hypothetical protein
MNKLFLLLLITLGTFTYSHAQLEKEDVMEIFSDMNIKSYPQFFIIFNSDGVTKHTMVDENLAAYEALNTKTLKIEYKENYIKISGESYEVFLPYDKIKYIHTVKDKSIQVRVNQ